MIHKHLSITEKAEVLLEDLRLEHGPLVFHVSGGCCDGSQPMCFPVGEFRMGESDVCLGEVAGSEIWMALDQYQYWKQSHITIDVVDGRGSSFSVEIPRGKRFILYSNLINPERPA